MPLEHTTRLVDACRRMVTGDIARLTAALDEFYPLVGQASAPEFRDRLGRFSRAETDYLIGSMVFGGQTTTDGALGFVIAESLAGRQERPDAEFVQDVLRRHPPFNYTLWRFTSAEVELGGRTLPPRSPLLIHIAGVNAHGTLPVRLRPMP